MMTLIACTQQHIAPDDCVNCGGWLHEELRGGYPGPAGSYCTEDCAADAQQRCDQADQAAHLHTRDLLCTCPTCVAAGHPTPQELDEWRTYQAGLR
jgi:hypothetical protein